jgi:DNA-binding response OmpR family regulator
VRLLAVDDEVDLLLLYRVVLDADGHEIVEATTGADALRLAREAASSEPFDLVLLDMMLPGMDGFGVLAGLAEEPATRDLPVVIVSARISVDDQIRGLESGAGAYLTKPFSIEHLRALIQDVGTRPREDLHRLRVEALDRLGGSDGASSSSSA